MRGRCSNPLRQAARITKKKATQSRNELAYMMIWGEEVPKGKKTLKPNRRYK